MQPTNSNVAEDIEIVCLTCDGEDTVTYETATGDPDSDRANGPAERHRVCPCCGGSGVVTAYHAMFCPDCLGAGDAALWESIDAAIHDAATKQRDADNRQYEAANPRLPLKAAA